MAGNTRGRPPGPGITPGKAIKRSGPARAERQRTIAFEAQPAEFLVALMQGEIPDGSDEPASLKERADIAKFLLNKIVGNAAQAPVEDVQGKNNADWTKLLEGESTKVVGVDDE